MFRHTARTPRRPRFAFQTGLDALPLRLAPSAGPMDPTIGPPDHLPPAEISPMDPTIGTGGCTFVPQTPCSSC